MQLIARRAQELTRASAGVIELAEGEEMVYAVTSGEATPYLGTRLRVATSLSGRCVREGRVLRSDDTSDDPRVDAEACRRVNADSMLCVPLCHQDETVGVLKVYSPEPHHFDASDVETLELLSELIAAHLSRASRSARPVSLCLFDLDGFKQVNDRHGHPAGDEVLRSVARLLENSRMADDCFRIGGDEFAILMPGTTAEEAQIGAERIATLVRSAALGDGEIGISFGIGTSSDLDSNALLAAADQALLAAKDRLYARNP